MRTAQIALSFVLDGRKSWSADWIWGCPLIVLTVIIHVLGIGYISQKAISIHADGGPASGRGYEANMPANIAGYTDDIYAASHRLGVDVAQAFANGADYIVVGRPIRRAPNPRAAAQAIQATIATLFSA